MWILVVSYVVMSYLFSWATNFFIGPILDYLYDKDYINYRCRGLKEDMAFACVLAPIAIPIIFVRYGVLFLSRFYINNLNSFLDKILNKKKD